MSSSHAEHLAPARRREETGCAHCGSSTAGLVENSHGDSRCMVGGRPNLELPLALSKARASSPVSSAVRYVLRYAGGKRMFEQTTLAALLVRAVAGRSLTWQVGCPWCADIAVTNERGEAVERPTATEPRNCGLTRKWRLRCTNKHVFHLGGAGEVPECWW